MQQVVITSELYTAFTELHRHIAAYVDYSPTKTNRRTRDETMAEVLRRIDEVSRHLAGNYGKPRAVHIDNGEASVS